MHVEQLAIKCPAFGLVLWGLVEKPKVFRAQVGELRSWSLTIHRRAVREDLGPESRQKMGRKRIRAVKDLTSPYGPTRSLDKVWIFGGGIILNRIYWCLCFDSEAIWVVVEELLPEIRDEAVWPDRTAFGENDC